MFDKMLVGRLGSVEEHCEHEVQLVHMGYGVAS